MSQSPSHEAADESDDWVRARVELSEMIKRGRSFSGHERNCLFLNTGTDHFATISSVSGVDFPDDARAVAFTDWNHDGRVDFWVSNRNAPRLRLLLNQTPTQHHSVSLKLVGNGENTSRDAVGARVEVVTKPPTSQRLVVSRRAGSGFLSQSTSWLHVGLGAATSIDHVIVDWPGGETETFKGLAVDKRYRLHQGNAQPELLNNNKRTLELVATSQPVPDATQHAAIRLESRLPMPRLTMERGGKEEILDFSERSRPVLVNLWATWCIPCLQELRDFSDHADALRAKGLDVIAVSVDHLSPDRDPTSNPDQTLQRLQFPFSSGRATPQMLDDLQSMHDSLVVLWRPLPIPTSFLIDANGRLAAIYKGPVDVAQLLEDVEFVRSDYVTTQQWAALLPGRSIDVTEVRDDARKAEMRIGYRVATQWKSKRRTADAIDAMRAVSQLDDEAKPPHDELALLLLQTGDLADAARHAARAIELDPSDASAHNTAGMISAGLRDLSTALKHYERAIELDDHSAAAHNNLGSVYATKGDLARAQTEFRRATEIDPEHAESRLNLGKVLAMRGEVVEGVRQLSRAIAIDPEYAEAYNDLGAVLVNARKVERAIPYFKRAVELGFQPASANLNRARRMIGND